MAIGPRATSIASAPLAGFFKDAARAGCSALGARYPCRLHRDFYRNDLRIAGFFLTTFLRSGRNAGNTLHFSPMAGKSALAPDSRPRRSLPRRRGAHRHIARIRAARSTRGPSRATRAGRACRPRPGLAVEMLQERRRDETGAGGEDAAVAVLRLAVDIEALRDDQRQFVPRPGHRDIEQPPLLLDLLRRAGREIGRDAAVDAIQDEDRAPFLPLGRMDGREDEIILVAQRRPRFVAGRVRADRASVRSRIARARGRSRRCAPAPRGRRSARRRRRSASRSAARARRRRRQARPARARRAWRGAACRSANGGKAGARARPAASAPTSRQSRRPPPRRRRSSRRSSARRPAEAGRRGSPPPGRAGSRRTASAPARPSHARRRETSGRRTSTNGMLRRVSSSSSAALWCDARNSTACDLSAAPASRLASTRGRDIARLIGLLGDGDERRRAPVRPVASRGPWRSARARARSPHWRRKGSPASNGSCGRA